TTCAIVIHLLLYEGCLRGDPADADSALALARILCRFGRFEPAARALQAVIVEAPSAPRAVECLRLLVACLDAMGAPEAAAAALSRLRSLEPSTPGRVSELLEAVFGHADGLRAESLQRQDELLAGRYRVLRELGEGASGRVLLADDIFHARRVAVKMLRLDGGLAGRDALARFLREARVAASIEDDHVVRVYEADASGPFLVMEYMAGGTLEERLVATEAAGRTLPGGEIESLSSSLLAGLEAVHRRGIVHRDLKPQNVFFGAAGELKIGDFGVAHLADQGATATGAMLGTLAYMAPEQIALSANPTAATDLYAFGVMLYRMLTGSLPFAGEDVALMKLDAPAQAPSLRCPDLGDGFDACLARLLARRPEDRPQSCEEVRLLLARLSFPEQGVGVSPTSTAPAPAAPRSSRPPAADQRYEPIPMEPGLALDRLLDRRVRLRALSASLAQRLRAFARADHPHLQAVFSLDEDAGHAVLEAPRGVSLGRVEPGFDRTASLRELSAALERVHAEGITHGAIDADHVLVAEGRSVLLLSFDAGGASAEDDRRALVECLDRLSSG
ncbi:MAG: protein kinase, partial [Deltaproteobacteria bacterium]|nr:protein kinase [Deltaproteobacteria bacterium]